MYILYILLYIDMKSTLSLSFYNIYILHPYILWLPRHFLRTAEALSLVIFIEGWCLSWISWLVFWDFSKPWFWWVEECEIKHDTQKNTKEHMLKWVPFTLRQSRMVCWNNSPFSLMMFSFKAPSNTLSNHLKGGFPPSYLMTTVLFKLIRTLAIHLASPYLGLSHWKKEVILQCCIHQQHMSWNIDIYIYRIHVHNKLYSDMFVTDLYIYIYT